MEFAVTPHISHVSQNKSFVFLALIFPPVKWTINDSLLTIRSNQGPQSTALFTEAWSLFPICLFGGAGRKPRQSLSKSMMFPRNHKGKGTMNHGKRQRSWEWGPDIEHLPSMSRALGLSPSPQEGEKGIGPEGRS